MDETLFRRLIGAAVLLLLAFALASLLPSPERKAGDARSPVVAYDLRTGRPLVEPVPTPPPVKLTPADNAVVTPPAAPPAAAAAKSPEAAAQPAKPEAKPQARPAPEIKPVLPPIKPKVVPGRPALKVDENFGATVPASWYVQIASFENQANARTVLQKLSRQGMPAMIQTVPAGKKVWYRVRVGPYPSETPAQQAQATLRQQGFATAKVIRPDAKGN